MPSIKYSALVSDMKGKSNGSVFSSNKQGAYFRNNRTGGGRKTAVWGKQKANFSFLSTQWKGLNFEQQQAWTNAAPMYPSLNKFKIEYIPSGFQLYMRLNGVLLAKGFPLLVLPGRKREFPSTLGAVVSDQASGTFTPNFSGGFNIPDNSNPNSNDPYCPQCYVDKDDTCSITMTDDMFLNCWATAQTTFSVEEPTECETDQDCKDAGLGTASQDICCQDNECVYCGDGIANQYQAGYLVPLGPVLTGGGLWDEKTSKDIQTFSESFRINLDASTIYALTILENPIVITSSVLGTGEGNRYKLEPVDKYTFKFCALIGYKGGEGGRGDFTYMVEFTIPIDIISHDVCVFSVEGNYSSERGWTLVIDQYENITPTCSTIPAWVAIADRNSTYPSSSPGFTTLPFDTTALTFAKILGAGVEGRQHKMSFGDYRYRLEYYAQTDRFFITAGGVLPTQIIASIAPTIEGTCGDGDAFCDPHNGLGTYGPFAQKNRCVSNRGGKLKCACRNGKCKKDNMQGLLNYGSASKELPTLAFVAPAYEFRDFSAEDYSLFFANTWVPFQDFPVVNNGATYTPTLYLNTEECSGDDFYVVVSVSKGKTNATLDGPYIYIGNFEMGLTYTVNLLPYIRAVIGNFVPMVWYTIKFETLDAATGQIASTNITSIVTNGNPGVVSHNSVRFKAGSDLSSSVN